MEQTAVQLLPVPGALPEEVGCVHVRETLARLGAQVFIGPAPFGLDVPGLATLVLVPRAGPEPDLCLPALLELPLCGPTAVLGPPELLAGQHESLVDAGVESLPAGDPAAIESRLVGWVARLRAGGSARGAALERAVAERDLAALHREALLRRVTWDRDELLRFVSHDLRTPITVLAGHCQMLAEGLIPPGKQADSLAAIRRQAENLGRLSRALLAGRHRLDRGVNDEPWRARDILEPLVSAAAQRADATGQVVRLLRCPDAVALRLPYATIEVLLAEVLDEALRATAPDGTLQLACEEQAGLVSLRLEASPAWALEVAERVRQGAASPLAGLAMLGGAAAVKDRGLEITLPGAASTGAGAVIVLGPEDEGIEAVVSFLRCAVPEVRGVRCGPGAAAAIRGARASVLVVVGGSPTLSAVVGVAGGASIIALGGPDGPLRRAGGLEWVPWPGDGRAVLDAVRRARLEAMRVQGGLTARPLDPETGLPRRSALAAHARAVTPAGGVPRVLLVSDIEVRDAPSDEAEPARQAALHWLAAQLGARCRPGDLVGRAGARDLGLSACGRTESELSALRDEVEDLLLRTRPRIGVTRCTVGARVQIVEFVDGAGEPGGTSTGYAGGGHAA